MRPMLNKSMVLQVDASHDWFDVAPGLKAIKLEFILTQNKAQ